MFFIRRFATVKAKIKMIKSEDKLFTSLSISEFLVATKIKRIIFLNKCITLTLFSKPDFLLLICVQKSVHAGTFHAFMQYSHFT